MPNETKPKAKSYGSEASFAGQSETQFLSGSNNGVSGTYHDDVTDRAIVCAVPHGEHGPLLNDDRAIACALPHGEHGPLLNDVARRKMTRLLELEEIKAEILKMAPWPRRRESTSHAA